MITTYAVCIAEPPHGEGLQRGPVSPFARAEQHGHAVAVTWRPVTYAAGLLLEDAQHIARRLLASRPRCEISIEPDLAHLDVELQPVDRWVIAPDEQGGSLKARRFPTRALADAVLQVLLQTTRRPWRLWRLGPDGSWAPPGPAVPAAGGVQ